MANESVRLQLGIAVIGFVGAIGAAVIARGGGGSEKPAPQIIQVVQNNNATQVQQAAVQQQVVEAPRRAPVFVPPPAPPPPVEPTPASYRCWRLTQIQEIGTTQVADLLMDLSDTRGVGVVRFPGHPEGEVSATVNGKQIDLTVRFPNGVTGQYAARLELDGSMTHGQTGGSNGARASWSAIPTECR
ncbi:MAG: hypothetical protein U0228_38135 [Myxococcaceae bacterium]